MLSKRSGEKTALYSGSSRLRATRATFCTGPFRGLEGTEQPIYFNSFALRNDRFHLNNCHYRLYFKYRKLLSVEDHVRNKISNLTLPILFFHGARHAKLSQTPSFADYINFLTTALQQLDKKFC